MTDEPDAQAFFETLSGANGGGYDRTDRYRDFRAVFLGTDQGQRVLHELLRQCGVNKSLLPGPIDPYRTHFNEGRRSVGTTIMGIMHNEPRDMPDRANSTKEK